VIADEYANRLALSTWPAHPLDRGSRPRARCGNALSGSETHGLSTQIASWGV